MEMKTFIMVSITVIVVVAPFVIVYLKNKCKTGKTKSVLSKYSSLYNSNIDESDTLGNMAIGIDYKQRRLFFIKHYKSKEVEQIIDLNEIKSVKLVNEKRSVKTGKTSTLVVERIELVLAKKDNSNQNIILEIYNENVNMVLSGEVQLANKWNTILENILHSN
ncbi:MAG: hypothetical protein R2863_09755 [Candidatus Kapaibacterium sp.]|nr:hypothetical protein [Romboutsia sp.]MCB0702481.1 hypothetical protein [Ignavibacteriota bacterium]MCB9221322.1 hypothetical protein [Ignavibacteria bacterium]